jgi:BA14K-like protein
MTISKFAIAAALVGAVAMASVNPASARHYSHRSYHHGGGAGAAAVAGIAGLIIGGIAASQAYPDYYYGPGPGYYYYPAPRVYYSPYDPAIAYCMRRFRSYDPYSMTYLGYDGYRHPCP